MSYYESVDGLGRHGFSEGMGATFTTGTASEGMRAIQQGLQRMGLLAAGTGPTGADGLWGLRTAIALGTARTRLGRTDAPFRTMTRGRVDIPDDFIAAIQAAGTPAPTVMMIAPGTPAPTVATIAAGPPLPVPDPSTTLPVAITTTPVPPLVEETRPPSRTRMYLMIGGGVLVLGGLAAFALWPKKATPAAVAANRRRSRRNKRRRYSRR
jgi:hypothetical protein